MGTHFSLVLRGKCPVCVLIRPVIFIPSKDKPLLSDAEIKGTSICKCSEVNFQTAKSSTLLLFNIFNVQRIDLFLLGKLFHFLDPVKFSGLLSLSLWYFLYHFKIIFSLHLKSLFFPSFPSCSSILLVYSFKKISLPFCIPALNMCWFLRMRWLIREIRTQQSYSLEPFGDTGKSTHIVKLRYCWKDTVCNGSTWEGSLSQISVWVNEHCQEIHAM